MSEPIGGRTVGPIPIQRETTYRTTRLPAKRSDAPPAAWTSLPGNPLAPGAARRFVRAALADWTGLGLPAAAGFTDWFADDAVVLVNELVTNAVVHAGTTVELVCHLEEARDDDPAALVVEVSDHHPTRVVRNEPAAPKSGGRGPEFGRGLHLIAALSERWGVTYRTGLKTVWARIPIEAGSGPPPSGAPADSVGQALQRGLRSVEILAPVPRRATREYDSGWINRGALSFLAEASDLLTGQFDEDMVAALAGQLLVPRLADWCAVWLEDEGGAPRLSRVWHQREAGIEELRVRVEKEPPRLPDSARGGPVPVPWPGEGDADGCDGTAVAYRLIAGGRALGTLMLGRAGLPRMPDEVTGLIEDFVRRVAVAVAAARRYTQQVTISRVLQRARGGGRHRARPALAAAARPGGPRGRRTARPAEPAAPRRRGGSGRGGGAAGRGERGRR